MIIKMDKDLIGALSTLILYTNHFIIANVKYISGLLQYVLKYFSIYGVVFASKLSYALFLS